MDTNETLLRSKLEKYQNTLTSQWGAAGKGAEDSELTIFKF